MVVLLFFIDFVISASVATTVIHAGSSAADDNDNTPVPPAAIHPDNSATDNNNSTRVPPAAIHPDNPVTDNNNNTSVPPVATLDNNLNVVATHVAEDGELARIFSDKTCTSFAEYFYHKIKCKNLDLGFYDKGGDIIAIIVDNLLEDIIDLLQNENKLDGKVEEVLRRLKQGIPQYQGSSMEEYQAAWDESHHEEIGEYFNEAIPLEFEDCRKEILEALMAQPLFVQFSLIRNRTHLHTHIVSIREALLPLTPIRPAVPVLDSARPPSSPYFLNCNLAGLLPLVPEDAVTLPPECVAFVNGLQPEMRRVTLSYFLYVFVSRVDDAHARVIRDHILKEHDPAAVLPLLRNAQALRDAIWHARVRLGGGSATG